MSSHPMLTICVPSRNRQIYFQETIRSLLATLRTDVEFVFADNSDDRTIMPAFMADVMADPRVIFLPSQDKHLSMTDNWERCLEAATGKYVCFIGDDDYVDPDVTDLLHRVCSETRSADVIVWSRISYNWPDNRLQSCNVGVPLKAGIHQIKREHLHEEFFTWKTHTATPNCPFSIYHGAVSKAMMDKIKARFGGRYFHHLTVDFETSCKLLVAAETFFYSERPFSVLGACFASNSGTVGNVAVLKERHAIIMAELGRNIDNDPYMKGFPFSALLGVTASIAQVQQWFKVTFNHKVINWEGNFAEACGKDCSIAKSRENFDLMVEGYTAAFRVWHNGRYLSRFKPAYEEYASKALFHGIMNDTLYLHEDAGDVTTPREIYLLVDQVLEPCSKLEVKFKTKTRRKAA